MNKISYSGYRFPPEIIQQAIWFYLRFTLRRRRRFIGGTRSGGVLRDGSALGESFRTDDCGRPAEASPETSHDLASRLRRPAAFAASLNSRPNWRAVVG